MPLLGLLNTLTKNMAYNIKGCINNAAFYTLKSFYSLTRLKIS
jgi:hypothetical protein